MWHPLRPWDWEELQSNFLVCVYVATTHTFWTRAGNQRQMESRIKPKEDRAKIKHLKANSPLIVVFLAPIPKILCLLTDWLTHRIQEDQARIEGGTSKIT